MEPAFALRAAEGPQSVFAFAPLKLRRTRFALRSRVAAPRVARQGEAWRPGLDLNQDKERCTALASTLSATGPVPIIADHAAVSHVYRLLTLTGRFIDQNACRATKVIRHGLWPILKCAREAVNPPAASFAIISCSL